MIALSLLSLVGATTRLLRLRVEHANVSRLTHIGFMFIATCAGFTLFLVFGVVAIVDYFI